MIFDEIREDIREPTRSNMLEVLHKVFGFDQSVLWDLQAKERGEGCWFGSISPKSVQELLRCFDGIEYGELDRAFDARRGALADQYAIVEYPGKEVYSGYLRQWDQLLRHAASNDAGVIMWVG
jgi:hypothetical protein